MHGEIVSWYFSQRIEVLVQGRAGQDSQTIISMGKEAEGKPLFCFPSLPSFKWQSTLLGSLLAGYCRLVKGALHWKEVDTKLSSTVGGTRMKRIIVSLAIILATILITFSLQGCAGGAYQGGGNKSATPSPSDRGKP